MSFLRFAAVAAFAVTVLVSSVPAAVRADRAPVTVCCTAPCCAAPCCAVPGVRPATVRRDYPVTVGKRTVLASSLAAPTASATSCCCAAGSSCCAASGGACCAASAGCCVGCCAQK